jgi:ribosomal protein S27AE
MNPSPLPQPAAQTCPNCGAAVEGFHRLCPNCGAQLGMAVSAGSGGCFTIFLQVALAGFALVSGLFGACFVLLGGTEANSGNFLTSGAGVFVLIGLAGVALAALCIWGIIKLGKR